MNTKTDNQATNGSTEAQDPSGSGLGGLTGSEFFDEGAEEFIKLAWKAGFHADTLVQFASIQNAVMLALSEGWNAESEDEIDHMHASFPFPNTD